MRFSKLLALSLTAAVFAAAGQTTANQLPLSGRSSGANGSVTATQSAIPGTTASVNTINSSVQISGPFAGSAGTTNRPGSASLSFRDAIRRGLQYNLGTVGLNQALRQANGISRSARSALLPNLNSSLSETVEQNNLAALGLRINLPIRGFSIPTVVGPFNYFDLRAKLTQTLADLTALNNFRSARSVERADAFFLRDARDMVVLAVGGAYLQVVAARARVEAAQAQLNTADAQFKQAQEQREAGVLAVTDLDRSEVQLLTTRERVTSLENDFAKQKINLARLTGLPPTDQYQVSDGLPFTPQTPLTLDSAIEQALSRRADLQAAQTQIRAAEYARSAARAERLPSLALNADYGAIGINPGEAHGTFSVVGSLRVPIWQGGRTEGDVEQAEATLAQRKAELEDLRSRVESDVRNAFLDLDAAASQVQVARRNLEVTKQTMELTRQRFEAGVGDTVEVVQAREAVAGAELDLINSVFAHNLAKLSLARAVGNAEDKLPALFGYQ